MENILLRLLNVEETNHVSAGSGICLNTGMAILTGITSAYLCYVLSEVAILSLGVGGIVTFAYLVSSENENLGAMHMC